MTDPVSTERLEEMLAGLDGVTPAPFVVYESCDPDTMRSILTELLASRQAPEGVRVKPLEWSSEPPYSVARVTALRLFYSTEAIWEDGVFQCVELRGGFASGNFPTVAEAKAAAQADYEARILSAIEPVTQTVASGAAMIEQMTDEEFCRDRSDENPNVGKLGTVDEAVEPVTQTVSEEMVDRFKAEFAHGRGLMMPSSEFVRRCLTAAFKGASHDKR